MNEFEKCPDCGVAVGEPHINECDVERCSVCGTQRITCECDGHERLMSVWTGQWPKRKDEERSLTLSTDQRIAARPQQCFYNAFSAITHCSEYKQAAYVEGMAWLGGLVIEHGWIELDDAIIDPTLSLDQGVYFPGLRFEGELELSSALEIPKPGHCDDLPIFYRFGFGGCESPEFLKAREAAMRLNKLMAKAMSHSRVSGRS